MEHETSGRKCATCEKPEREHKFSPSGWVLGHAFKVRPGDEWCAECDDWVVNGCGSVRACEAEQEEAALIREDEERALW